MSVALTRANEPDTEAVVWSDTHPLRSVFSGSRLASVAVMRVSRRTLLRAAPGALAWASRAHAEARTAVRHSSFDPWIEVLPDHVRHNIREVSRLVEGRPILAVIKNNAYGMGLVNMARILETEPAVKGMAVVKLSEAIALRDAGITKPILLMGPFDEADLEEAVMRGVMPMVYTGVGDALDRLATARQSAVPVQVCVDTGMGRVGVSFRQAAGLIADLAGRKGVSIVGTMTTLNEDPEYEELQLQRFREVHGHLAASGVSTGRRHAASSYALFDNPPAYGPGWRSSASTRRPDFGKRTCSICGRP